MLVRAAVTASSAGAALFIGGSATANATIDLKPPNLPAAAGGLSNDIAHSIAPLKALQLNPLANTGVDPLDNSVGTQVSDGPGVSSTAATGALSRGASVTGLPVVGPVAGMLPG